MRSFIACHIPDRRDHEHKSDSDQISPSASSTRDLGTSLTAQAQFLTLLAAKNLTSILAFKFLND